ncbi:MAG: hypothetical protein NZ959_11105 [Armatimonadetes bacterium]|nr:hypothetical protein [Armatimonadota bacterium]MDW8122601.1 DUF6785 family protein [Armatimonadota bacterium]
MSKILDNVQISQVEKLIWDGREKGFPTGLILTITAAALGVLTPYADLLIPIHRPTAAHLSSGVFGLLTILVALRGVSRRLQTLLSVRQVFLIYSALNFCSALSSSGFVAYLLPMLAAPRYFASPTNQWDYLFLKHLPSWYLVQDKALVVDFYQGLPSWALADWRGWVAPVGFWLLFGTVYFSGTFLLALWLERRWVVDEKLSFPTVQIVTSPLQSDRAPTAFLAGLVLPFVVHGINNLSRIVTFLPTLNLRHQWGQVFHQFPFDVWQGETLTLSAALTGIGFLIPAEVAVSFWGFYWFQLIVRVILRWRGMVPGVGTAGIGTLQRAQEAGAFFALAGFFLTPAIRSALRRENGTYRDKVGAVGWVLALALLVVLLRASGLSVVWGVLLMIIWSVVHIVLTRIVSAGGVMRVECSFMPWDLLVRIFGVERVGWKNLSLIAFPQQILMFDQVTIPLPYLMDGFKLMRTFSLSFSRYVLFLVIAYLVTIGTSLPTSFLIPHQRGGLTVNTWFTKDEAVWAFNKLSSWATAPFGTDSFYLRHFAFGFLFAWLLQQAHRNLPWWSVSPIGFVMATTGTMRSQWFPIFLGWLLRSLSVRLHGLRGYQSIRPVFVGMVWGELLSNAFWLTVNLFVPVQGVPIFPPE